ncbi:MAG TPA: HD domain-containing protein [Vicinamibacteria bacterium]|nr:HD domain-containing protein [Vicinamibacteria bacterium]
MTTLDDVQDRLEQAFRGAERADDREIASRIRDEGHRLLFLLNGLVRATRLYALDNEALAGPASELAEVLADLVERLGMVQLVLVEDQAYLNDVRLRVRPLEQGVVDQLSADLARHEAGGLTFHQKLDSTSLKRLARTVSAPAEGPRPVASLRARIAEVGDVEVSGRWRFRLGEEESDGPLSHAEVLSRAEGAVRDTLARLAAGWMPNPLRIRRVVIDLVDVLRSRPDAAALAPFAGIPGTSERHLLSVCQLSLMLGYAIGLPDAALSDLGVAALLHDVGYLDSRDPLRHALAGTRLLLRQRGFSEAKIRRLRAVLEHHVDVGAGSPPSLFARILHVADEYDLLVAWREGGEDPVSPATALARMWAGRGTRYDPTILALLAQQLGLYPPGTLLDLTDGRAAMVVRARQGREGWARPLVRVVRDSDGTTPEGGVAIDLLAGKPEVQRVVEPAAAGSSVVAACRAALASL